MNALVIEEPSLPLDQPSVSQRDLEIDDALARTLVRDLHKVNRTIFWSDLLLSALLGWAAFAYAVALPGFSLRTGIAVVVSAMALYRCLCFLHEISHQNKRTLPGFEATYNALVGFLLLMPSFVYVGVHQSHHKISVYGTKDDPEYMPFAQSCLMTTVFAAESFFIPVILLVRFLLLTPLSLIVPSFERWTIIHLSSLTMNVQYQREMSPDLARKVRTHSLMIWVLWAVAIALVIAGTLPLKVFLIWLMVDGIVSFVNSLRTLGAHAYESDGQPMDRLGQLRDSIDHPGYFWTELWAPVGLRYHALHHYFPGIPYHALPEAYRRLTTALPIGQSYVRMSNPSLPFSLRTLFTKGMCIFRRN